MTGTEPVSQRAGTRFGPGWQMLLRDLRTVRGPAIRVVAWSTVQGLPALASGRVLALALDRGFLAHRPVTGVLYLLGLGGCLLAAGAAARAMFPWLARTVEPLRDVLVGRLVRVTMAQAAARADIPDTVAVARLTSQVETVRALVGAIVRAARPSVVSLLAALAGLLTLAPAAAMFVLVPLVVSAGVFAASLRSLTDRRRAVVVLDEQIAAEAGRVLSATRDIAACNAQDRATARLDALIGQQAAAVVRLARAAGLRTVTISTGGALPLIGLLAAGSWLVRDGSLSAGQLIGALAYVTTGLLPAIRSVVTVASTWGIQLGTVLDRIQRACVPPPAPVSARDSAPEPSGYAICARHAGFRYGASGEPVIAGLSLDVPEGDHLAIIGPSGAGKSTLAQLLAGGLAPDQGAVTLGGVSVDTLAARRRYQTVALIPQETYVFAGTLRENLAYLRPDADDEQLSRAAEATGLTELAARLGGFGAVVGADGATLSSGEAQLVTATRAYLSAAAVVILDEATCHLDPSAEARVEEAFVARPGTLIVVAHRISSAQRAGRVLLLDGTHAVLATPDELPALSPLYAELLSCWQPHGTARPGRNATAPGFSAIRRSADVQTPAAGVP